MPAVGQDHQPAVAVEVDEARGRRPCRSRRSSVRRARGAASPGPRTRIRPSTTATVPGRPGAPVPSTIVPPVMSRSACSVIGRPCGPAMRRRLTRARASAMPDECLKIACHAVAGIDVAGAPKAASADGRGVDGEQGIRLRAFPVQDPECQSPIPQDAGRRRCRRALRAERQRLEDDADTRSRATGAPDRRRR